METGGGKKDYGGRRKSCQTRNRIQRKISLPDSADFVGKEMQGRRKKSGWEKDVGGV